MIQATESALALQREGLIGVMPTAHEGAGLMMWILSPASSMSIHLDPGGRYEHMTDTQKEQEMTGLNYSEAKATELQVGDSVQDKGLVVSVEDTDDSGKVVGFGSMRGDEPQVDESVTYGSDDKVQKAVSTMSAASGESSGN